MKFRITNTIAIVTAIVTLLSASAVFAATTTNSSIQAPKFPRKQSIEVNGAFRRHMDSLVKAGIITRVQENAIQKAMILSKSDFNKGNKTGLKSPLAAPKAGGAKGNFKRGDNGGFKAILDGLVKDGTITQAQEVAIEG